MARTPRRTVGEEVQRLAEQLSNDLLIEEHACFEGLQVTWLSAQGHAEAEFGKSLKGGGVAKALKSGIIGRKAATIAGKAAGPMLDHCSALFTAALDMALASIGDELRACESSLAAKYAGVAVLATEAVKTRKDELLVEMGVQIGGRAEEILGLLVEDVDGQVRLAMSADKGDPDMLLRRMFSNTPVRAPGLSGRGVWWRPVAALQRDARAVEIAGVNSVRSAAMTAMNDAGSRL